ncbi:MAG: HAD family hydrolase [Clostridiales bacterium]|nr:HAD family hydrolase [Clostridiales bacterium]
MPRYKAVIFDLDGTLCYTLDDLAASMNEMLGILGHKKNTEEELLQNINHGARTFVLKSLPDGIDESSAEFEKAFALYDALYYLHCADNVRFYDGMEETIFRLKDAGIKLFVHTNKQDAPSHKILTHLLPEGTFDMIIGAGIFNVKPDPEASLHIASEFGLSPEEVVFCGDSDVDMKTARNAGMFPLGVAWGFRPKEVLIENGAELIAEKAEDIADFVLNS